MPLNELFIASWNVENLFDTENAVRPQKVFNKIKSDIAGWDDTLLDAKLGQLSKIIRAMNGGKGPDILGVYEVENRAVLDKLTSRISADGGRTYQVAHADTSDERGIDVAFLYDPAVASASEWFQHWIVKRYPTRELFQVNFTVGGQKLVLVGNHWPSRTAGQYESEPFRIVAGETLAYWIQRIHEELGKDVGIIVMGDFNDEPFNRSVQEHALGISDDRAVLKGTNYYLLNLMWPIIASGTGSYFYGGRWNMLDQIMVNKPLLNGKFGWEVKDGVRVECTDIMCCANNPGPRRFGIKPGQRDKEGFSDHFPVSVTLQKI